MSKFCRNVVPAVASFAISLAIFGAGTAPACAQDAANLYGMQFFVTPYLWLASVHATTLTPLAREPQINSNVSTIDLLSHLEGAPLMGSAEVRYGSVGFLVDAIHLPMRSPRVISFSGRQRSAEGGYRHRDRPLPVLPGPGAVC